MMTIMRMRSAILTIAYCISAVFSGSMISEGFGKLAIHPFMPGTREISYLNLPKVGNIASFFFHTWFVLLVFGFTMVRHERMVLALVRKLHSVRYLGLQIFGKLLCQLNLCYHVLARCLVKRREPARG